MEAEVSHKFRRYYELFGRKYDLGMERPYWQALDLISKREGIKVNRCIMNAIGETVADKRIPPDIREYCVRKLLVMVQEGERSPSVMRRPWGRR